MKKEKTIIFKGYLRGLIRQLKSIKKELDNNNIEKVKTIIDELIEDTQKNIQD